jgi:hypothetical protein
MRQCTVFQFRIDLLDDCVLPVDLVRQNSVEALLIEGGEEGVVSVQVE